MSEPTSRHGYAGILFLLTAFIIWGVAPVYWKQLETVPALDIILFRVIWSLMSILPFFLWGVLKTRTPFFGVIRSKFGLRMLLPAVLLGANWLIYVWADNNDHIIEASLGYYINPLVNVLLGHVFLKEKLTRLQKAAVTVAATGVLFYIVVAHVPLWIALSLAFTFGFYGLLRKTSPLGSLDGLLFEMVLLSMLALPMIFHRGTISGASSGWNLKIYILLAGTGPLTALPLVTFTMGARRVPLHTVGFMQYLAPSCSFLIGLFYYHEPFPWPLMVTFCFIWGALVIFSWDLAGSSRSGYNRATIDKKGSA